MSTWDKSVQENLSCSGISLVVVCQLLWSCKTMCVNVTLYEKNELVSANRCRVICKYQQSICSFTKWKLFCKLSIYLKKNHTFWIWFPIQTIDYSISSMIFYNAITVKLLSISRESITHPWTVPTDALSLNWEIWQTLHWVFCLHIHKLIIVIRTFRSAVLHMLTKSDEGEHSSWVAYLDTVVRGRHWLAWTLKVS